MGPIGRAAWTVGLLLFFPWWALGMPLRSIWRREAVAPDAPPTLLERFRERHPRLGTEIRVGPTARLVVLAAAVLVFVAIFFTKHDVDRFLFGAPVLAAGLMVALARWNDL